MTWEILKNAFFTVGSVGGLLAFFQTAFKSVAAANKSRWSEFEGAIFNEDIAASMIKTLKRDSTIYPRSIDHLHNLIQAAQPNSVVFEFKWYFNNTYDRHRVRILTIARTLVDDLGCEGWRPKPVQHIDGFIASVRDAAELCDMKRLEPTTHSLELLEHEIRKVRLKATREDYEYVLPWKWWQYR